MKRCERASNKYQKNLLRGAPLCRFSHLLHPPSCVKRPKIFHFKRKHCKNIPDTHSQGSTDVSPMCVRIFPKLAHTPTQTLTINTCFRTCKANLTSPLLYNKPTMFTDTRYSCVLVTSMCTVHKYNVPLRIRRRFPARLHVTN